MKLIIEIDDQTYKAVQLHPECFNFANAILNAKPLQTELDEIKAKIINISKEPYYEHEGEDWTNGLTIAENLIDNRIREIKELNNE